MILYVLTTEVTILPVTGNALSSGELSVTWNVYIVYHLPSSRNWFHGDGLIEYNCIKTLSIQVGHKHAATGPGRIFSGSMGGDRTYHLSLVS